MPLAPNLEAVFASVRASPKYRLLAPDFVRAITQREAPKERNQASAIKRVKRRLHQLVGAYFDFRPDYASWLTQIRAAAGDEQLSAVLHDIMRQHVSTRERIQSSPDFYQRIFEGLPPPRTIADLGCGLSPLARRWMPFPAETTLVVYDVVPDMVEFVLEALRIMGFPASGGVWDLLDGPPNVAADIVLLLKTLPCLAHADKDIGRRILSALKAPLIIVSYPVASIGGRKHGMAPFYDQQFEQLTRGLAYEIEPLALPGELVFRLHRKAA